MRRRPGSKRWKSVDGWYGDAVVIKTHESDVAVIGCFARFFGPRAKAPIEYVERAWAEEIYTRGCYAGYLPPGTWTSLGFALRSPCGRIHWAGTETAQVWNGYMDGAISSGERAARDVLAAGVQTLASGTAARSEPTRS